MWKLRSSAWIIAQTIFCVIAFMDGASVPVTIVAVTGNAWCFINAILELRRGQ